MKKTLLLFIVMIASLQYVIAQRQLTGTVREAGTNQPLSGASVNLQGLSVGSITNVEGKFTITVPEKTKAHFLIVQFGWLSLKFVSVVSNRFL
jgi:hypothetical protein